MIFSSNLIGCVFSLCTSRNYVELTAGGENFHDFVDMEHIFLKNFGCIPRVELHKIFSIFNRVADLGKFYNRVLASGRLR